MSVEWDPNRECEVRGRNSYLKSELYQMLDDNSIKYAKRWGKKELCDLLRNKLKKGDKEIREVKRVRFILPGEEKGEKEEKKKCSDFKVNELRKLASGIVGRWKMRKDELCKKLHLSGGIKKERKESKKSKEKGKKRKLFSIPEIKTRLSLIINKLEIQELLDPELLDKIGGQIYMEFKMNNEQLKIVMELIIEIIERILKSKLKLFAYEMISKDPDVTIDDIQAEIDSQFNPKEHLSERFYHNIEKLLQKKSKQKRDLESEEKELFEGCEPCDEDDKECKLRELDKNLEPFQDLPCIKNSNVNLKDYQLRVIAHMLNNHGLIAIHSTGTGKTLTAITASQCYLHLHPGNKVMIVTPNDTLRENFKKEMKAYGMNPNDTRYEFYTIVGFSNKYENIKDPKFFKNKFLIIDEGHHLTTEIIGLKKGLRSRIFVNASKYIDKILILTATPIKNRPSEFSNLIAMVDGKDPLSKRVFNSEIINDNNLHIPDMKRFNNYFNCKISIFKCPKIEGYPKRIDKEKIIKMDQDYYENYYEIQKGQIKPGFEDLFNVEKNVTKFYNGIRKATNSLLRENSPKINWIIKKIQESQEKNQKILIYTGFIGAGMNLIKKRLDDMKIKYVYITGKQSLNQRQLAIAKYNPTPKQIKQAMKKGYYKKRDDEIDVLLISEAGGEGIDLKGTRIIIIMEPDWNEANIEQIIGRGIRYLSHDYLPKDQQTVTVYRLFMTKPDNLEKNDNLPSADILLKNLSLKKDKVLTEFMSILDQASIEKNRNCKLNKVNRGSEGSEESDDVPLSSLSKLIKRKSKRE